jgi:hypothetical protein
LGISIDPLCKAARNESKKKAGISVRRLTLRIIELEKVMELQSGVVLSLWKILPVPGL